MCFVCWMNHNTFFMSSWLRRFRLFNFQFLAQLRCYVDFEMVRVQFPRYDYHSLQWYQRISALSFFLLLNCLILRSSQSHEQLGMCSVHYDISPSATIRYSETDGRHFSKFAVFGFLLCTADAYVVPRHGSVHLGLRDFFFEVYSSRSAVFRLNRLTSGRMQLLTMHRRSCVQGSEWLVPQVALLHTWAGEDQCRVNPLQRYYLSHTH